MRRCTTRVVLGLWAIAAAGPMRAQEADVMRYEVEAADSGPARLDVFAGRRARKPISRRLFGKFTEHLGRNVYNGIWAQILRNPGFEDADKFHADVLRRRLAAAEKAYGIGGLAGAPENGVAPYWAPWGAAAEHSLDPKARNSSHCQRIRRASAAGSSGVQQVLHLPLHRVADYELTFWARARDVRSVRISVHLDGETVSEATVSGLRREWSKHAARLRVTAPARERHAAMLLRVAFSGAGTLWLDQLFLFPADHVHGFDPDVIRLWRDARMPLLRFPGGNFVSGYHWRDGVGPIDERPTRPNPAWPEAEYNHVGVDEMMAFCRAVGCEPMICVNAGDGSPAEAGAWVEYCNGGAGTEYGRLRARYGHPAPYNVRLWEVGNELYGRWQIGHCNAAAYAGRYARFAKAMLAADPTIELVANGHDRAWNAEVVRRCGAAVRSLSVHSLIGARVPRQADPAAVFEALMAYTHAYPNLLRSLGSPMQQAGLAPRLAITELQLFTKHRRLPTNSSLAEALWAASVINVGIRAGGAVELVTHSALLNHGGGVRKEREVVWAQPVYFTHKLYGTQSGVRPVHVKFTGPCYETARVPGLPHARRAPTLDAVALASQSGDELTVIVVNRSAARTLRTRLVLTDFEAGPDVTVREVGGPGFTARNTFGRRTTVKLRESDVRIGRAGLTHEFAPHSLTAIVFRRKG